MHLNDRNRWMDACACACNKANEVRFANASKSLPQYAVYLSCQRPGMVCAHELRNIECALVFFSAWWAAAALQLTIPQTSLKHIMGDVMARSREADTTQITPRSH